MRKAAALKVAGNEQEVIKTIKYNLKERPSIREASNLMALS